MDARDFRQDRGVGVSIGDPDIDTARSSRRAGAQSSLGVGDCVPLHVSDVPRRAYKQQQDCCPGGSGYRDSAAPARIVTRGHVIRR